VVAYLPRWLLCSIVVAGRGVRPTGDRSVVVRTFQLESGVSLEKEGEEIDIEIVNESEDALVLELVSLPWIGDVEWISFIEGRGRKELKHAWI